MHRNMAGEAREGEDGALLEDKGALSPSPMDDVEGGGRRRHQGSAAVPTRRYAVPKLSLRTMMILCNISVMLLVGFTFYQWTREYPYLRMPQPAAGDDGDKDVAGGSSSSSSTITITAITTAPTTAPTATAPTTTTTAVPQIPPSDSFDLTKTGFVVAAQPKLREFFLNISRADGQPDGFAKPMIFVNGQSPGPLIEANIGDTLRVVVHNGLADEPTTVHWHGIDQRNSAWMDGLFGVTQCGIPPGESFTYEFDVPGQRGTFWYHSHVTGQYTDGLFGPLIVHDPDEMIDAVDEDRIIMVGDLYHQTEKELLDDYLNRSHQQLKMKRMRMSGMEPSPDNIVINGRHVRECTSGAPGHAQRQADGELTYGHCQHGSVYSTRVRSGQRVRLRLISHSSNVPIWFSVDGHVLHMVEMDGVEIEPIATTRVFIQPGQRYSVLLTADQPAGNYHMRATAVRRCAMIHFNEQIAGLNYEATGLLSYDDVDATQPPPADVGAWSLTSDTSPGVGAEPWGDACADFAFDLAKPRRAADAFAVSKANDHHVRFEMRREGGALKTFIDGTVFAPMHDRAIIWDVPGQSERSLDGDESALAPRWHFGSNQHVMVSSDEDSAAQIAISAANMMYHPWHLHGQTFQVVGWGAGDYGVGETTWNLNNPMRRDTVTVPGNSHVVIRIKADNPGIWALHCHIQWHAEGGMFAMTAQRLYELKHLLSHLDPEDDLPQKFCPAKRQ